MTAADDRLAPILALCALHGFTPADYWDLMLKLQDKAQTWVLLTMSPEEVSSVLDHSHYDKDECVHHVAGLELTPDEYPKLEALPDTFWAPLAQQAVAYYNLPDHVWEWFDDLRADMVAEGIKRARMEGRLL